MESRTCQTHLLGVTFTPDPIANPIPNPTPIPSTLTPNPNPSTLTPIPNPPRTLTGASGLVGRILAIGLFRVPVSTPGVSVRDEGWGQS